MKAHIETLKEELAKRDISFAYFAGSWCPMCVDSTPKVMDMMNKAGLAPEQISVYSVNMLKTEPREAINRYRVHRVPTLIVEEGGKELGRITEYTHSSWLEDTVGIITK